MTVSVSKLTSLVESADLTRSAQLAMIAATAVSLSWLGTLAGTSLLQSPLQSPGLPRIERKLPTLDIAKLTNVQLFGKPGTPGKVRSEAPPTTRLNWVLQGVFTGASPNLGSAIIVTGGAPAKLYRAAQRLPGGATLEEVHPDHVVLQQEGRREMLRFPSIADLSTSSSASLSIATHSTAPTTTHKQAPTGSATLQQRRELVRQRLEQLRQRALTSS